MERESGSLSLFLTGGTLPVVLVDHYHSAKIPKIMGTMQYDGMRNWRDRPFSNCKNTKNP